MISAISYNIIIFCLSSRRCRISIDRERIDREWRKSETNRNRFDRNGKMKELRIIRNWSLAANSKQASDRCVYPHTLRAYGTYYKLADIVVDVICVRNNLIYGHFKVCVFYIYSRYGNRRKKYKQTNERHNQSVFMNKKRTFVDSIAFRVGWIAFRIQDQFNCLISDNRQNWKNQHFLYGFWSAMGNWTCFTDFQLESNGIKRYNKNHNDNDNDDSVEDGEKIGQRQQLQKKSQLFDCTYYAVPKNP